LGLASWRVVRARIFSSITFLKLTPFDVVKDLGDGHTRRQSDKHGSLFKSTNNKFVVISNFPLVVFKMDRLEVETLSRPKEEVTKDPSAMITIFREFVVI
jgi:hypothetical protein